MAVAGPAIAALDREAPLSRVSLVAGPRFEPASVRFSWVVVAPSILVRLAIAALAGNGESILVSC